METPYNIYQVELSSYCNMRCSYCPHPSMKRPKGFMNEEVLGKCIELLILRKKKLIVLHHFGEPLMHPYLKQRLEQVANSGLEIQLSSNALLLDKMWPTLLEVRCKISVMVSVHQWVNSGEDAYISAINDLKNRASGTNIEILEAYNIKNESFVFHSWSQGLSDQWDVHECPFIKFNYGVILWNGDLAACCVDHEGYTVAGNILNEDFLNYKTLPWKACATCDVGRIMIGENWED